MGTDSHILDDTAIAMRTAVARLTLEDDASMFANGKMKKSKQQRGPDGQFISYGKEDEEELDAMMGTSMIGGRKKGASTVSRASAVDDVVMSSSVPDSRSSRAARATEGMKFPSTKNKNKNRKNNNNQ